MTKKQLPPIVDEWRGCYPSNWTGIIIPEAMSHPAKYSSKLIRRIYEHAQAEGWIQPGSRVIDPFGGVGLGALEAMRRGLHWTGIELESRFVELGGMSYECPGFTSQWWASLQAEPEEKRKEMIRELRVSFQLCPSCETALTPKFSKKKGPEPQTPERAPHIYRGNIPSWAHRFSKSMPNFGTARLLQGDSRNLLALVQASDLAVGSPPYAESILKRDDPGRGTGQTSIHDNRKLINKEAGNTSLVNYGHTPGQLGDMPDQGFDLSISSPPYEGTGLDYKDNGLIERGGRGEYKRPYMDQQTENYGHTSGQLGSMPSGDFDLSLSNPPYNLPMSQDHNGSRGGERGTNPSEAGAFVKYGNTPGQLEGMSDKGFDLSVSSPPFLQSTGGTPEPKPGGSINPSLQARHAAGNKAAQAYGETDGQLSDMDDHDFHLAVSSPPFNVQQTEGGLATMVKGRGDYQMTPSTPSPGINAGYQNQAFTPGNLANEEINSFWLAARAIVDQTFAALRPGGHAIFVVKGYVKDKKFIDFPDQWRQLCEAAGFVTLHEHHASLVHHKGTSINFEGEMIHHKTESKSFFRRVYEGKGGHRIDFETVFCMVKE